MAPEVIDGKMYTEMADVYSFAMVPPSLATLRFDVHGPPARCAR